MNRIKSAFKQGLLFFAVPGIIVYFMLALISALDGLWLAVFNLTFGKTPFWGAGLLASVLVILIFGLILTSRLFHNKYAQDIANKIISRIPIFNLFWGKDFFAKKELEKTKAALVEYPSPGWFQIGFIIGKQKMNGEEFYKILVPTVPVPATGYLAITVVKDKVRPLKNPPAEILKLIFSCGFAHLDNLEFEDE